MPAGHVYFLADDAGDAIKIGYATNVGERVAALQTGNPRPLKVLASIPAEPSVERRLHAVLSPLRLQGEWFRRVPAVHLFVVAAAQGLSELFRMLPEGMTVVWSEEDVFESDAEINRWICLTYGICFDPTLG